MSVQGRGLPIPFMVTTEVPCPYLPDRMERKIITELSGAQAPELFEIGLRLRAGVGCDLRGVAQHVARLEVLAEIGRAHV